METSFKMWRAYFLRNKEHFAQINLNVEPELSAAEKKLIYTSLQQFQKGESSEGLHLLKAAKDSGDAEYLEAIKLFIQEEHGHSTVLARYMRQENIPLIKGHWTDVVFRSLRKFPELEHTIIVLLTAEIIAKLYYQALKNAVASPTLKAICNQILSDEEMHISFQAYTLHRFHRKSSKAKRAAQRAYHRILMTGTSLVVWIYHGDIFRRAGISFANYVNMVEDEFNRSEEMIEGYRSIVIRGSESLHLVTDYTALTNY